MDNIKIVAVVGLAGSGKTEAVLRFIEHGFERIRFSEPVYAELDRLGLEKNEANERTVREGLRKDFGMGVMAERSMPFLEELIAENKKVVIESLYSWSEYNVVREKFGNQFRVLATYAPPQLRYARLATRSVRPLTEDQSRSRDYAEIENIEKGGPIAMADWTISNTGTKERFLNDIDVLIKEIINI